MEIPFKKWAYCLENCLIYILTEGFHIFYIFLWPKLCKVFIYILTVFKICQMTFSQLLPCFFIPVVKSLSNDNHNLTNVLLLHYNMVWYRSHNLPNFGGLKLPILGSIHIYYLWCTKCIGALQKSWTQCLWEKDTFSKEYIHWIPYVK